MPVGSLSPGKKIELTNQDGEAMAIPREDSAALMEGMMLHRQGLARMARIRTQTAATHTSADTTTTAAATPAAAATAAPDGVHAKKARRRPLSPPRAAAAAPAKADDANVAASPATAAKNSTGSSGSTDAVGIGKSGGDRGTCEEDGATVAGSNTEKDEEDAPRESGGWEERKDNESNAMPQEEQQHEGKGKGPLRAAGEGDGMDVVSDGAAADKGDRDYCMTRLGSFLSPSLTDRGVLGFGSSNSSSSRRPTPRVQGRNGQRSAACIRRIHSSADTRFCTALDNCAHTHP